MRPPPTGPTYRFATTWRLTAPPAQVFAALAEVDRYAEWWPQVRRLRRSSPDSGVAWVRSLLPYTLRLELTRRVQDPATGRLRVDVAGDLVGWCEFAVRADGAGTRAAYRQEVGLGPRAGLGVAARWARPLLLANHAWMLRCGERGLRRHLARSWNPTAARCNAQ